MSEAADEEDKTEDPTPEKRKEARKEGRFARARDAASTVGQLAALGALALVFDRAVPALGAWARRCFSGEGGAVLHDPNELAQGALLEIAWLAVPALAAACLAAFAVSVAEAGWHVHWELAAPKWERIDPLSHLGQMLSPKTAAGNVLLALARVGFVGFATFKVGEAALPGLLQAAATSLPRAVSELTAVSVKVLLYASGALLVASALDFGWSWFQLEKSLRMTKQELKDEYKQQEGDPKLKAQQRQRAREMARRGIGKALKEATAVVVNPTHFAVVLRYGPRDPAPVVTAKGVDEVALFIRELAEKHSVPVVHEPPLARALHASVKIGAVVPRELYVAVAQILAVVYRLKRGRGREGARGTGLARPRA